MSKFSVQDIITGKTTLVTCDCDLEKAIEYLQLEDSLSSEYNILHYISKVDIGTSMDFIFDDYTYNAIIELNLN